jgi:hypothetical protein
MGEHIDADGYDVAAYLIIFGASIPGLFHFFAMLPGAPFVSRGLEFPGTLFGVLSPFGVLVAIGAALWFRKSLSRWGKVVVAAVVLLAAAGALNYSSKLLDLFGSWA